MSHFTHFLVWHRVMIYVKKKKSRNDIWRGCLQEKRKVYDEQKEKQETQHVSFLDAIRNELDDEVP